MKNKISRNTIAKIILSILRIAFLISISYIVIFQLVYMVSYAVRPESQMNDPSVVWVPKSFTMLHFKNAMKAMDYVKSFWHTLSIQVISGIFEIGSCAVAAYGFARFKFRGQNLLFLMVIITIFIPSQMIAVPMYLSYSHFDFLSLLKITGNIFGKELRPNLLDTGFVFWLPSLFGVGLRSGLFIFIFRQFFKGLPKELEEAAYIDGAGAFRTFMNVIVPSSSVAIITVAIFSLIWHWNEYYLSILYFNDNYPLSVRLSQITASLNAMSEADNRGVRMAGCLLLALPMLLVYAVLQRKFVASIDRVGIVG